MTGFRRIVADRRWVHGVLGVWVLAWAMVLFEPCCDAIASPSPNHASAVSVEHHEHDAAAESDSDLALHHDNCEHVDARDLSQPVDVVNARLRVPQHAAIVLHTIASTFPPSIATMPEELRPAAARASPIPLYLRTLRLRD